MKRTFFVLSVSAALLLSSCGFLKNSTSTSTSTTSTTTTSSADAVQAGKAAGNAMDALYTQYKTDGKLDMKNIMNIANMVSLVGAAQQLKDNKSDSSFRQGFIQGIIANSVNVDKTNAETITDQLTDFVSSNVNTDSLTSALQKGQSATTEVQNAANSVSNILNLFKK